MTFLDIKALSNLYAYNAEHCCHIDDELTELSWLTHFSFPDLKAIDTVQCAPPDSDESEDDLKFYLERLMHELQTFANNDSPNERPPHSFGCLIFLALESHENKKLSVTEILSWISSNFPFYQAFPRRLRTSIRQTLSLNRCFVKVNPFSRHTLWTINPLYHSSLSAVFKESLGKNADPSKQYPLYNFVSNEVRPHSKSVETRSASVERTRSWSFPVKKRSVVCLKNCTRKRYMRSYNSDDVFSYVSPTKFPKLCNKEASEIVDQKMDSSDGVDSDCTSYSTGSYYSDASNEDSAEDSSDDVSMSARSLSPLVNGFCQFRHQNSANT